MEFYVLLLFIILGLFFISHRYPSLEREISLMLLGILILIGGFRDRIGWDFNNYTTWYLKGTRDDGLEFGFLTVMKVFRYLNFDYELLFFFFSFFTYLFAYLGIRKYTEKSSLSLVLYFLIPVLFLYSFTYIRQYLSVTISFYAFSFLLERKYYAYFLWMLVGVSFHYSCLIPFLVFPLVLVCGNSIKNYHLYILMGVSFVIAKIGFIYWASLLLKGSHYLFYVSDKEAVSVPFLKLLIMNIMGVLVILYYDKKELQNDYRRYLLLLYICSLLFLNLFSESTELTRVYIYFRVFEVILVGDIIHDALLNKRLWLISFICCFYFFPYFRAIHLNSESSCIQEFKLIPYKTLLLKRN